MISFNIKAKSVILGFILIYSLAANAQIFTKVINSSNPIVTTLPANTLYNGAAWVDYDNDEKLDLYALKVGLFHNDGGGNFTKILNSGLPLSDGFSTSWADVNNDGSIDCFVTGGTVGSKLFINNGSGAFNQYNSPPFDIPNQLSGFGSCWGDYNNDGNIDLFIASPDGFFGITGDNKFIHNNGGLSFTKIDTSIITQTGTQTYTNCVFSDYDLDGDVDLFIPSGTVNGTPAADFMFKNEWFPSSGNAFFTQTIPAPISTSLNDSQQYSFIDFDNDLDLDLFFTNYYGTNTTNGYPNTLFRNDNGTYVQLTGVDVGQLVTDVNTSLANVWQDFDNDGDLDVIIINDAGEANQYYQSNISQGSTVFTKITNEPFTVAATNVYFSASAGDFDNDGDVDFYILGQGADCALFQNNTTTTGQQIDFINIKLVGNPSNKSGIGAKVYAKAPVNSMGPSVWQMREITASNSFNGMNMLNVSFGFGINNGPIALTIDSLIILWPSGTTDICTNISASYFYEAKEGQCLTLTTIRSFENSSKDFYLESIYPNPIGDYLTITVPDKFLNQLVSYKVTDTAGRIVSNGIFNNSIKINTQSLSNGVYFLTAISEKNCSTQSFIK